MTGTALNLVLAVVAAGLGIALALSQGARQPMTVPRLELGAVEIERQRVAIARPPIAGFAEISDRPLFSETRRPPTATTEAATPVRLAPPPFQLMGLALAGETRRALIETPKLGTVLARIGEEIGGWEVVAIETSRIVLSKAGHSVVLHLDDQTITGGAPIAGTAAPALAPRTRAVRPGRRSSSAASRTLPPIVQDFDIDD